MAKTPKPNIREVTLSIATTAKGKLIVKAIESDGTEHLSLPFFKPTDTSLNGTMVLLHLENGKPVKITSLEKTEIASAQVINQLTSNLMDDSYRMSNTMLPDFIRNLLPSDIDNFHLKFNRAARFDDQEIKFKHHSTDDSNGRFPFSLRANFGAQCQALLDSLSFNTKHRAQSLGYDMEELMVSSPANGFPRLAIGLGNESVYENGMTLHHIYGIPYLPGSAIKGITRNYIINSHFTKDDNGNILAEGKDWEKQALKDDLFAFLVGTGGDGDEGGSRGNAMFFDAFPTAPPSIEPDVMNNHYQSFYDGDTPPADWISPNPIFFLTVKNAGFRIYVGMRADVTVGEKESWKTSKALIVPGTSTLFGEQSKVTDLLAAWVKAALAHHGIGAKTAVGYGRLR